MANKYVRGACEYVQKKYTENFWDFVVTVALVILLLGFAGYKGFSWWQYKRYEEAERAFLDSIETYQKAITYNYTPEAAKYRNELWDQVEMDFQMAYDRFGSTPLGPVFLMFEAQALLAKGQTDQALALMESAIKKIKKSNPLRYLYTITHALVLLDQPGRQPDGVAAMDALANDAKNPFKDMAQYYIGEYYSSLGDVEKASSYWNAVIQEASKKEQSPYVPASVWLAAAQKQLGIA